ncbi:hypothetical protein F7725_013208 [Dissostichus mawsoni]|uniref:Uncharacterized protein n=1 Tax=Dissostichus mawsoni TaxID=36200 RepID=A0A7J5YPL0_DISMA|nr:hypothetical protein F7725_013208 [Dissostichus mawsoni]
MKATDACSSGRVTTRLETPGRLNSSTSFNDVVWHVSWSITGNILAVSGGDNKVKATGTGPCQVKLIYKA